MDMALSAILASVISMGATVFDWRHWYMPPRLSQRNSSDGGRAEGECPGEIALRKKTTEVHLAHQVYVDFANVRLRLKCVDSNESAVVPFFKQSIPASGLHVFRVLFFGTKDQVLWIIARRIVTGVADTFFPRVNSGREEESNAVREEGLISGSVFNPTISNASVSMFCGCSNPWPAFIWTEHVYPIPEGGDSFWRKLWQRPIIISRHLISLKDWCLGPYGISTIPRGSLHYAMEVA